MMKRVMVEIDTAEVAVTSLQDTLEYIEECIANNKHGVGTRVFDSDYEEDLKQLKKFRKALKKVISWYAP